jgi:hypothetical protein
MAWHWRRRTSNPEALGSILPQLTCQTATMRQELARLSREIMAVHVALERLGAQLSDTEKVRLLASRDGVPPLKPEEFTTEWRQR